jgi:hypothetical protein
VAALRAVELGVERVESEPVEADGGDPEVGGASS